ncbi:hypothetical protein WKW79_34755 [Variovorax robiniae]|uniref:Uncharacterized protein n=1 Tax=Variovorax robiniae TaxID=1836199 RepID=A0ABU8XL67_9BURK
MKLETSKFSRLAAVCAECEGRSDGPRHLDSKWAAKELRRLGSDALVRVRIVRTRCLGMYPRKALAGVVFGEALPAVTAEMQDEADLRALARYAFGSTPKG